MVALIKDKIRDPGRSGRKQCNEHDGEVVNGADHRHRHRECRTGCRQQPVRRESLPYTRQPGGSCDGPYAQRGEQQTVPARAERQLVRRDEGKQSP